MSLSIIDDRVFKGFRLNGSSRTITSGSDYECAREKWADRAIRFESERMVDRLKGFFSAREAEMSIPKDFVIVEFTAVDGAIVKPGRILRAGDISGA